MNRELKFRVWDNLNKRYVDDCIISNSGDAFYYVTTEVPFPASCYYNIKNAIIQQFTGLLDKTGRGIYEGDILQIKVTGTILIFALGDYKATVKWNDEQLRYDLDILTKKNKHSNFNNSLYKDSGREYEIIGNIYENPELLTKTVE